MTRRFGFTTLWALALLAGCVTINVYFPAASAQKAADRIIDDVWGPNSPGANAAPPDHNAAPAPGPQSARQSPPLALALLDLIIPPAYAAEPKIDISAPAVQGIVKDMEARFSRLKPYYDSGAVGLTSNATITIRDMSAVPLAKRNQIKQLVADENADRKALYHEIAVANNHPDWEPRIRAIFSKRWIDKARPGWYYQNNSGGWQRK